MKKIGEKKKTIGIGLAIALLMVTSTFTIGTIADDPCFAGLEVVKEVWNGNQWANETESWVGCIVEFQITATYYAPPQCQQCYHMNKTVITDILPLCLEFIEITSLSPSGPGYPEFDVTDNVLTWDFGDFEFVHSESIWITFTAAVVDYGMNVNTVQVTAEEQYGGTFEQLYDEDNATVYVYGLEVEKQVWNKETQEWADYLEWVELGEYLRYQITITPHAEDIMKCMVVEDFIQACCLEYVGNEEFEYPEYPDSELFSDPEIIVTGLPGPDPDVIWDWSGSLFNLYNDQSIIIRFDVNVTSYHYHDLVTNHVDVSLWSCPECLPLEGFADCSITCEPRPTNFEKEVWDGNEWAEETTAIVGETVRFKFSLFFYEEMPDSHLYNIEIVDHLPECLEYVTGSATIEPSDVSADNKTIWWYITDIIVNDTEPLFIEFDALAVGTSGCCGAENIAEVDADIFCEGHFADCDTANVSVEENSPPINLNIEGDTSGETGESLTFKVKAGDPNGHQVYYTFDWGGTGIIINLWHGPYNEGEWIEGFTHFWSSEGSYLVKVKAKDIHGAESDWSNPWPVTITTSGDDDDDDDDDDDRNVTITGVKGGIGLYGKITATIKNNGTEDGKMVNWSIKVEGTFLTRKNVETNGSVVIDAGQEESVDGVGKKKIFGFGRITVTITADAEEYGYDTEVVEGWIIGPFVRIKP